MGQRVWLVVEGELPEYYNSYCLHAVFSERTTAENYAAHLVSLNEPVRWTNCCVVEFELNRIGHIEYREVALNE
jgi:hypothetical protein